MEVMIGVDPHKESHTAPMLDRTERELTRIKVRAGRRQVAELLEWANAYTSRAWAVECAAGMGYLPSQQLVAAGETVLDVPATLASRARVWAPANRPRRIRTTPARLPSPRCTHRRWRWCDPLTTSRSVGCWPSITLTWPAGRPSCAAGCTRWSASSSRAGSTRSSRQPGTIVARRHHLWRCGSGRTAPSGGRARRRNRTPRHRPTGLESTHHRRGGGVGDDLDGDLRGRPDRRLHAHRLQR